MTDELELTELAEVIYNFKLDIPAIKANIRSFLLANHYVQLDPDQRLPEVESIPFALDPSIPMVSLAGIGLEKTMRLAYAEAQRKLIEEGWRKVVKP